MIQLIIVDVVAKLNVKLAKAQLVPVNHVILHLFINIIILILVYLHVLKELILEKLMELLMHVLIVHNIIAKYVIQQPVFNVAELIHFTKEFVFFLVLYPQFYKLYHQLEHVLDV